MSDIPVGSPPAPPGRHAAPGGWYPDPLDGRRERYWDGWQWSRQTRELEGPAQQPPPQQGFGWAGQPPYGSGPVGTPGGYVAGGTGGSLRQAWTADGVPLAGWWWRALAGLVDGLITGIVSGVASIPLYRGLFAAVRDYWNAAFVAAQAGQQPPPTPNFAGLLSTSDQLLSVVVVLVVGFAYHLPFLRRRGATPGLMLCGLRVVPVDEGRSTGPLPWATVGLRATLWILPWALSLWILTLADALIPLWHPKRQTLHDLAARTQVVRLR